jgi:hypothetical protein
MNSCNYYNSSNIAKCCALIHNGDHEFKAKFCKFCGKKLVYMSESDYREKEKNKRY